MKGVAPLRSRPFRRLFVGRTVTSLGTAIAPVALGFAVLDATGSLAALGVVVGLRSVANVAVLLLGGVVSDRWPRHVVLAGSQAVAAVAQGAVAAAVLTGRASVPLLAGLGVVNGLAAGIGFPAAAALVPSTVPSSQLRQANALSRLGVTTALIAGASAGGFLVAVAGPGWGLAVDAASFAIAAVCFARMGLPGDRVAPSTSVLQDLRAGWVEVRRRHWVVAVVAQACVLNACFQGCVVVLGPAVADAHLGRASWGLALTAFNVGLLAGGVLAVRWLPSRALAWGVALCLLAAPPMLAMAFTPDLLPIAITLLVFGFGLEQFSVAWDVSLQERIPPDRLARVYSYDALGSFLAIPLGQVAVGPLAEAYGAQPVLAACAALTTVATLATLAVPSVRHLRRRTPTADASGSAVATG